MAQLGASADGEVLVPGRVPGCYLCLRLDQAGQADTVDVLVVMPAALLHAAVPQPDGTVLYELVTGHPDRAAYGLAFLADLTVELRAWPYGTWASLGIDPQAAAGPATIPGAADTRSLRQCPQRTTAARTHGDSAASTADTGPAAAVWLAAAGQGRSLRRTAPLTSRPGPDAAAARACCGTPGRHPRPARLDALVNPPRSTWAGGNGMPTGADTGRALWTPVAPEHLAQRTPATAAWSRMDTAAASPTGQ